MKRVGNFCKYDFDYQYSANIFPTQINKGFNDFYYYKDNFDKIKNNKNENNQPKLDLRKNSNSNSFASTSESESKNLIIEDNNNITEIIKKGLNSISTSILTNRDDNFSLASFYHCNHRNEDNYKYICSNKLKSLLEYYLQKDK